MGSGEPAVIDLAVRYLYGAPGANLEVSGEYVVAALGRAGIQGLEGWQSACRTRTFETVSGEIEEKSTTDAKGKRPHHGRPSDLGAPQPIEAKIALRVGETGGRTSSAP